MELNCNSIVVNRRGDVGAVACIVGKPHLVVYKTYTQQISAFDKDGKHKNTNYDIIDVYNGEKIDNPTDIFKKGFSVEGLELLHHGK